MSNFLQERMNVPLPFQWLGKMILRFSGWKIEGNLGDLQKAVIIVAHHTSNWDFWHGLMYSFATRLKVYWLGKHTLFKPPFGGLLRKLGGIPIDRRSKFNVVEQAVQAFQNSESLLLAMAPEGTRKRVAKWKTGFYYIAQNARVPIVLGFIDYQKKKLGFGPILYPSGDLKSDWEKIKSFYQNVVPKYPEKAGRLDFALKES